MHCCARGEFRISYGVQEVQKVLSGPASAKDRKHQIMVHNEQVRMDSNFLYSLATFLVTAGGFAPIIGILVWYMQNQNRTGEVPPAVVGATIFCLGAVSFAAWFKHRARVLLARLKTAD